MRSMCCSKYEKDVLQKHPPTQNNGTTGELAVDIGYMNGPTTPSEKTCYLGVIDEGSRFKWVVLLERNKDASNALIKVIEDVEMEFVMKVKTVC